MEGARLLSPRYALAATLGLLSALSAVPGSADGSVGERIFESSCVDCHGAQGQGTDYYSIPLTGDLPTSQLAEYIAKTMPEGDPDACVGEDAEAVAQYLYDAFYSPFAQARNAPPRRELSRLTVRQYEQTIADLAGSFRWRAEWGDQRGLNATFTKKRNVATIGKEAELVLPRVDLLLSEFERLDDSFRDPTLEVEAEGGNKRIDVHLTISGSLLAPVTGYYEFFVRTAGGVRLNINDEQLIDQRVRSGSEPEVRARTKLLGGRIYSIRLGCGRIKQDDLEVRLGWKPPGGADEIIPTRFLSVRHAPPVAVTEARFPPDDRSVGYVRGASVSAAWSEAVTEAALENTAALQAAAPDLIGDGKLPLTEYEAQEFCRSVAQAAFRRKLNDDEKWRFVDRFFHSDLAGGDATISPLELSVLSVLKSPRFLYPEIGLAVAGTDSERTAARLALLLWDSLPDRDLKRAAESDSLASLDQARQHAERMLDDRRTKAKLNQFFRHWLRLDETSQLSRDPDAFPDFNDRVAADMRSSLEMLIDEVVWRGDGDLRQLFLSGDLFVNARLARFLGVEAPIDRGSPETFVKASIDTHHRVGVVSHPFMLTSLAYYRDTSPIHRGVFLARHILGRSLRPPPEAVAPLAPELAPEMTTRQRVSVQTSPHQCQACHVLINDLGFTLENFDAVGRFRDADVGQPVDSSGGYVATDGSQVSLSGSRELAEYLATSDDVHRSFVTQLFEHLTKQPMLAYGPELQQELLSEFRESGFNIRGLLVSAVSAAALAE